MEAAERSMHLTHSATEVNFPPETTVWNRSRHFYGQTTAQIPCFKGEIKVKKKKKKSVHKLQDSQLWPD